MTDSFLAGGPKAYALILHYFEPIPKGFKLLAGDKRSAITGFC